MSNAIKDNRFTALRQRKKDQGERSVQIWLGPAEKSLLSALRREKAETISVFFNRLIREESRRFFG